MMRPSGIRHALAALLLTMIQIKRVSSVPIVPELGICQHDHKCDPYPISKESLTSEPVRTVLESSDGHVYVPYTDYTTSGAPQYSKTRLTSYHTTTTIVVLTSTIQTTAASTIPVLSTESINTSSYTLPLNSELTSLTPSAIQTASSSAKADLSGTIITSLNTAGETSALPFATSIASASGSLSLINTFNTSLPQPTMSTTASTLSVNSIYTAFQTGAPPQVSQRADHPVARLGIAPQTKKLSTNKFYANFFLGSQTSATFTHPYSVAWAKGAGGAGSYGLSISHIERSQVAYGSGNPAPFFINPIGIQSLILSANELNSSTNLTTDSLDAFSVNVNLLPPAGNAPVITFPLCQGMGFVTGVYSNATPKIQSSVSFLSVTAVGLVASGSTYKYRATLGDQNTWLIYVTNSQAGYPVNTFTLSNGTLQGAAGFNGFIQVAKVPTGTQDAESVYDGSVGAYPVSATVTGSTSGVSGTYGLSWTKGGQANRTLLMFALPHHMDIISRTSAKVTDIQLQTTTKGIATGIVADSWTLVEPSLPVDMGFSPWSPTQRSINAVSSQAAALINAAGNSELSQNMTAQTYLDSMYYSGKALAKFAGIVYAVHDIGGNATLAVTGLQKLESAFAAFVNNTQTNPLVYESAWGGVVSSGTYKTGDSGLDFGNTYYNDHHFHYGYFVYAAAVIGYLDPAWLTTGANKAWVNMLVRDYANSVSNDAYFPFSRSFDWYHGHSWAKGLFESGDGKDQESTSEDAMASYAIKMWGRTINDQAMEARGNLMLAMQARSFQKYFLYQADNVVEPAQFIGNKVSGILFENKIDHTTYFGSNVEYIEGIHMLPLMPFSTLTRTKQFVTEEWNTYFSNGRVDSIAGGWRGILYANLAIIDPVTSYKWFSQSNFDMSFLDGGASLTWYLTWSAALGGAPASTATKRFVVGGEEMARNESIGGSTGVNEVKEELDEDEVARGKEKREAVKETDDTDKQAEQVNRLAAEEKGKGGKKSGGKVSSFLSRLSLRAAKLGL